WMTKVLIDEVLPGADSFWTLERIVIFLGIIYFAGVIINFVRNYITSRLGNRMTIDIRKKLYEHMQSLSQRFYDSRQVGGIVSRVLHDVNGAQHLVGGGVINIIVDL